MKVKSVTIITVVGVLLMISGPMLAHHGMAAFDMENVTTVKGTITNFEFINPHVLIYLDVVGEKGEVQTLACRKPEQQPSEQNGLG